MISIVVPFYCTKKEYFDKCMMSLLKDKEADVEILIIDDGSPEEYQTIINSYVSDQRVKIFHENHKGVSNARNIGMINATGEWLMFVDSDDYLEDGYAKDLIALTEDTDADIIIFNGYGDRYGKSIKNKYFIKEHKDYGISVEDKCMVMGAGLALGRTPEYHRCFYTLGAPYSKLLKVDYIKRNDIKFDDDIKFAEDTLFSMNLIMKANHIYYSDLYLYHYYMNEESVTGKYRKGLAEDMDLFFQTAWQFIKENDLTSQLEESYYIRAFLESQRCLRQEFCHKKNNDKDWKLKAIHFINKEPYQSGIVSNYAYMKKRECRIASFLLRHGMISEYIRLYDFLTWMRKKKLYNKDT